MFYIIEIQKQTDGTYSHLIQTAETKSAAESKFYGVLQYAAISTLPLHSAVLIDDHGVDLMSRAYERKEEEE